MNKRFNCSTENSPAKYLLKFLLFEIVFIAISLAFISFYSLIYNTNSKTNTVAPSNAEAYPNNLIIIIDAGHGGEDGGAVSQCGIVEKDLNLDVANKTKTFLEAFGVQVIMTRSDDKLLYEAGQENRKKFHDISNRIKIVQNCENPIAVSIHQNKFPIRKYKGFQVYYSKNHSGSKRLADLMQNNVKTNLQPENNRATKQADKNIRLLDSIYSPAVLVECGFLSNPEETELLNTEQYRNKIAYVISISILQYINEM